MDAEAFSSASDRILTAINTVIDGKAEAAKLALTVLLAQGHLLLEDVPGVGRHSSPRLLPAPSTVR